MVPVWLEAGQTALAQRLYTTYGDRVGIRFGSLTYPINRARFRTSRTTTRRTRTPGRRR